MARMYDRPTLGPDGWVVDETPTPAALAWSLDASGNPVGLVGPDGSTIFVPQILAQVGTPIGIAPTGTMGANGAVTLGTALNTTYSGGLWMYYPAGAVYAGSVAGFYWTVMSSTTVGTVYNNIYVPGTNSWDIPASPTAIVAAGPGAFTGVTSEITAVSVTLPGGSLGNHGALRTKNRFLHPNNANNKICIEKFGGTVVATGIRTTTTVARSSNWIRNCGLQTKQLHNIGGTAFNDGTTTVAQAQLSINTAADVTCAVSLQMAVATDYAILADYSFIVEPS